MAKTSNRFILPEGIASYVPTAFTPKAFKGRGKVRYSMSMIYPESWLETGELDELLAEHKALVDEAFGGQMPYNAIGKLPYTLGSERYPNDPFYADKLIVSLLATESHPPQITDGTNGNQEILDQRIFYSGCKCKVYVNLYSYNEESAGISIGMIIISKTADGDKLGNAIPDANNIFGNAPSKPTVAPPQKKTTGAPQPPLKDGELKLKAMAKLLGYELSDLRESGWSDDDILTEGRKLDSSSDIPF